jgi:hypothetical protein
MGVRPDIVYINNTVALEKMKTGEIAGIASTGGKPNDPVRQTEARTRIPFLSIDYGPKLADSYIPAPCPLPPVPRRLSAADPGGTNDRNLVDAGRARRRQLSQAF